MIRRNLCLVFPLMLSATTAVAQTESAAEDEILGIWKISCEAGPCQAFMNIRSGEEDIVAWSILADPKEQTATALVRVSLDVALPPGIRVVPNDGEAMTIPFQFCRENGCTAIARLTEDMQSALSASDELELIYFAYGQSSPYAYKIPFTGFGDALARLLKNETD